MVGRSERLVCRRCGGEFRDRRGLQLPGLEDPPAEFCRTCEAAQRWLLAAAIRGPLPRFDVDRRRWYARLRAEGLPRDVARLLVDAFAPEDGTGPRRKPGAGRRGSTPRERSRA